MFKTYQANLLNAVILVAMGLWAFIEKGNPTALIPVFVGAILWIYTNDLKAGNKTVAHALVVLTFLMLLGTLMPMRGEMMLGDMMGVFRALVMFASCAMAMYYFIDSFREARKARLQS